MPVFPDCNRENERGSGRADDARGRDAEVTFVFSVTDTSSPVRGLRLTRRYNWLSEYFTLRTGFALLDVSQSSPRGTRAADQIPDAWGRQTNIAVTLCIIMLLSVTVVVGIFYATKWF